MSVHRENIALLKLRRKGLVICRNCGKSAATSPCGRCEAAAIEAEEAERENAARRRGGYGYGTDRERRLH